MRETAGSFLTAAAGLFTGHGLAVRSKVDHPGMALCPGAIFTLGAV
jgi:hypothetical protein